MRIAALKLVDRLPLSKFYPMIRPFFSVMVRSDKLVLRSELLACCLSIGCTEQVLDHSEKESLETGKLNTIRVGPCSAR